MATIHGFRPALIAVTTNLSVAILKTIGYAFSGSSAMFSEAVHSYADTANQALLLVGVRRSRKVADKAYSYGYGNERFLWALISACGIFFLGAGITLYQGYSALLHPEHHTISWFTFFVLIVAGIAEAYALSVAYNELRRGKKGHTLRRLLNEGDPITIAVVYEDTVAVLGVITALAGIMLTYITGNSIWDAIASLIIGLLLAIVAVLLIQKNREFLIGKSMPEDEEEGIKELLLSEPCIESVSSFKSSVLDIGSYHVQCEIEFNGAALLEDIGGGKELKETFEEINDDYESFKRFMMYHTNRVPRIMGRKIDAVEKKIIAQYPAVSYIDIEIN